MRTAYRIAQHLMWDAQFRRRFAQDRRAAIDEYYPEYADEGLFGATALTEGLEEEAYRRLAWLQRTSKEIFPCAHHLLLAYCGGELFEEMLRRFFDLRFETAAAVNALDILDPFDGYIVGPLLLSLANDRISSRMGWINGVMNYEWAVWHARRVATGWPAIINNHPLIPGASLVETTFDLKSLLKEAKRLEAFSVSTELYQWRIVPGAGIFRAAIYPRDGSVVEAKLDQDSYGKIAAAIGQNSCQLNDDLRSTIQSIGLILQASFLCCSNEAAPTNDLSTRIPAIVEPEPH